jgi:hypothetical protein
MNSRLGPALSRKTTVCASNVLLWMIPINNYIENVRTRMGLVPKDTGQPTFLGSNEFSAVIAWFAMLPNVFSRLMLSQGTRQSKSGFRKNSWLRELENASVRSVSVLGGKWRLETHA